MSMFAEPHRMEMLSCLHLHLGCISVVPRFCSLDQGRPAEPSPPCSPDSWGRCGYQHCPGPPTWRGLPWTCPPPPLGAWQRPPWLGAPAWVWGLWWRPEGRDSCNRRTSLTCGRHHRAVAPRELFYTISHWSVHSPGTCNDCSTRVSSIFITENGFSFSNTSLDLVHFGSLENYYFTKRWLKEERFHLWVTLHWLASFLLNIKMSLRSVLLLPTYYLYRN